MNEIDKNFGVWVKEKPSNSRMIDRIGDFTVFAELNENFGKINVIFDELKEGIYFVEKPDLSDIQRQYIIAVNKDTRRTDLVIDELENVISGVLRGYKAEPGQYYFNGCVERIEEKIRENKERNKNYLDDGNIKNMSCYFYTRDIDGSINKELGGLDSYFIENHENLTKYSGNGKFYLERENENGINELFKFREDFNFPSSVVFLKQFDEFNKKVAERENKERKKGVKI
jgi:hypothetical protein